MLSTVNFWWIVGAAGETEKGIGRAKKIWPFFSFFPLSESRQFSLLTFFELLSLISIAGLLSELGFLCLTLVCHIKVHGGRENCEMKLTLVGLQNLLNETV